MITQQDLFTQLAAPFGAETHSIDLSLPLSPEIVSVIRSSFLKYGALVFRDQKVADKHLVFLCEIFGPLEEHLIENNDNKIMTPVHEITNFDINGVPSSRPYINTNYFWHTDKSYLSIPSFTRLSCHLLEVTPNLRTWVWPMKHCQK